MRRFVEADERVHEILTTFASSPDRHGVPVGSPVFIDLLIEGLRSSRKAKGPPTAHGELIDPMSSREMEILDGLLEGLTYREMADQLYISRDTAKTHVSHVYTKLGVASRDAPSRRRVDSASPDQSSPSSATDSTTRPRSRIRANTP